MPHKIRRNLISRESKKLTICEDVYLMIYCKNEKRIMSRIQKLLETIKHHCYNSKKVYGISLL